MEERFFSKMLNLGCQLSDIVYMVIMDDALQNKDVLNEKHENKESMISYSDIMDFSFNGEVYARG